MLASMVAGRKVVDVTDVLHFRRIKSASVSYSAPGGFQKSGKVMLSGNVFCVWVIGEYNFFSRCHIFQVASGTGQSKPSLSCSDCMGTAKAGLRCFARRQSRHSFRGWQRAAASAALLGQCIRSESLTVIGRSGSSGPGKYAVRVVKQRGENKRCIE